MRHAARLAASLLLAASLAVPAAAAASSVITPPGSSFGLAPPQGYTDAPGFAGFANPAQPGASIAITEFPPQAYAQLERGMDAAALAARGIDMTASGPFATTAGDGILITATQRAAGQVLAKWMLLVPARAGDQSATALIVVTLPGTADAAADDAIRAALATLTYSPLTFEGRLAALPFAFQPGPTLKPAHTMGRTSVVLTPQGGQAPPGGPLVAIAFAPGRTTDPANRIGAATTMTRQMGNTTPATLDPPVQQGDTVRLSGTTRESNGILLRFTQWVTFLPQGYIRIVALAPEAAFPAMAPEFDAIAASVSAK
jgi:hypothetical protein